MKYAVYPTPMGDLYFIFDGSSLHSIDTQAPAGLTRQNLPVHWQQDMDAYFAGKLKKFAHPPSDRGTAFQQAVWQEIARIPYGQTTTYSAIAVKLASHPRAVGQACGKNPLPIVIPCHRVLGQNGQLGGFSMGDGSNNLNLKYFLLKLEGALP